MVPKTIVDSIGDPLMHIVRNSMDHGIEESEEELPSRRQGSNLQPGVYSDQYKLLYVSLVEAGVRFERTVSY